MSNRTLSPTQRSAQPSIAALTMSHALSHPHYHHVLEHAHESIDLCIPPSNVWILARIIPRHKLDNQRVLLVLRRVSVMFGKLGFLQQIAHGVVVVGGDVDCRIGMYLDSTVDGIGGPLRYAGLVLLECKIFFVNSEAFIRVFDAKVHGGVAGWDELQRVHGAFDALGKGLRWREEKAEYFVVSANGLGSTSEVDKESVSGRLRNDL